MRNNQKPYTNPKEKTNKPQWVDLHLHTHYSDGSASPAQMVKDCALLGLETIAITDHDNLRGYYEAREASREWNIHVIPGVEISTEIFHILAYDFNPELLQGVVEQNRKHINEKTYRRIEKLNDMGFPIQKEKLDAMFPNRMLNKIHLAEYMIKDKTCREKINEYDSTNIIKTHMNKSTPAGQIKHDYYYAEYEILNSIKAAGGTAILAHPPKHKESMELLDFLRGHGLDGIEVQPRYKEKNQPFIDYARKHNMIITYGSDNHGARYLPRPLLGKENNNKMKPFWKDWRPKEILSDEEEWDEFVVGRRERRKKQENKDKKTKSKSNEDETHIPSYWPYESPIHNPDYNTGWH